MKWYWPVLAGVVLWWGLASLRERGERLGGDPRSEPRRRSDTASGGAADDGIDRETLEQAEREVRDLDVNARPEDGFSGDDWGPGAPRPPAA
jgi:hypothetical protein